MFYSQAQKMSKHQAARANSKLSSVPIGMGLASMFVAAIFMSGCVVHHPGHGYKHGHGHAHGHHKGKIKIKPKAEISVSPMIVIDD